MNRQQIYVLQYLMCLCVRARVCVCLKRVRVMDPHMNTNMGRMSVPYGGNETAD